MTSDASPAVLVDAGEGRCTVAGDLTLATSESLWRQLRDSGLMHGTRTVDLGQVRESDSAGLALLIAWRAGCLAGGGDLHVTSLPDRLAALARLTDANAILSG
jgi:ABC-type transporter Mla MlaB component